MKLGFYCLPILLLPCCLYGQHTVSPKLNWRIENPLQQRVFIENGEGQFDEKAPAGEKISYKTTLGGVDIYFTNKGILYSYDEIKKSHRESGKKDRDPDEAIVTKINHLAKFNWKGTNPFVQFIPEDEVSFYYSHSKDTIHTTIAHAFKRILCRNLHPGIDLEYSFPANASSLLCTIYSHPGADTGNVQLIYEGMVASGKRTSVNVTIRNDIGDFILLKQDEESIPMNIDESNKEIGLSLKTATSSSLWITNPAFTKYDGLYDICYDNIGNVYMYGGYGPYQLAKINSSGNLQWIYNVAFPDTLGNYYYGDFVTDKTTGTSYVAEGVNDGAGGAEIIKVNTLGKIVNSVQAGPTMSEFWRIDLNYCTHQIIIGGGGRVDVCQVATTDTSLSGINTINVLGAIDGKHDIAVLTADRQGPYCYMATSVANDFSSDFDNVLMQCPLPSVVPPAYMNYDTHAFVELQSNSYVNDIPLETNGEIAANGINGIVSTANTVYIWDGRLMSSYDKNSGTLLSSKWINPDVRGSFNEELITCGGIDADYCENIYIGNGSTIDVLDSSFNIVNVLNLPSSSDTVYDLHVLPAGILYACGYGFVASYSIPSFLPSLTKSSTPACSGCNGTAHVSLSGCEPEQISWSNGNVGEFVYNLCAGTYTVTAMVNCSTIISDTISILPSSNPSVAIPSTDVKEVSCFDEKNGTAKAIASRGTPPYTYAWYPTNSSGDTITNLAPGTYTFMVTDVYGCAAVDTVTITQPEILNASISSSGTILAGATGTLTASASGGTAPYTYNWTNNQGSSATINISPLNTITYTVNITDKNGCTTIATITVDVICGDVFIPDAFSPNGDGHNDFFYVRGDCITDMTFEVFDRWGNTVFSSTNVNDGWDGNYKGLPLNMGTYVWFLKATLRDGSQIERKGNVALVR